MRILTIHNKYLLAGGEDRCHLAEVHLLRKNGHSVNEFVQENQRIHSIGIIRTSMRTLWSIEAYRQIKKILKERHYDLVLVQNFFPLISPSVFYAASHFGVPVFQFVHNFRLLCLNALLFRENHVCENCIGKVFPWPGIRYACYRNSTAGSSVIASMIYLHKTLGTWNRKVSQYIALTEFSRNKMIVGGFKAEKISVRPNYLDKDPGVGGNDREDIVFIGRLSHEKGLLTLLEAWNNFPQIKLKIIGNGPLFSTISEYIQRKSLFNIELLGQLPYNEIFYHLKKSKILIMPSIWYETFGRTIIEAYATGTPVIASNIGAMREIVQNSSTGLHFKPGDPIDLAEKVTWAIDHPKEMAAMGKAARSEYEAKYTARKAYEKLMEIYSRVVNE